MEFLLKGFAKEFQAKHGAPGNKNPKDDKGQKATGRQMPAAGNAAKKKNNSTNKKNAVNGKELGTSGSCPHILKNTAVANKENLLGEFEKPELNHELNKKQRKKLRQKLRKQEIKLLKESAAATYDQDLPTTSAKARLSQAKINNVEILKDKAKNANQVNKENLNVKTPEQLQKKPQIMHKVSTVNAPSGSQVIDNNKDQSTNAKKKSFEMSSNVNKDSSNNSKNKDAKLNSNKNMLSPSKVPNNNHNKDNAAKQQEQKKVKPIIPFETKSSDLLKPLESKHPRHCELLKPLIFAVPEGELISWVRQIQIMIWSLVSNTKEVSPFYVIGRHFDMRSTVTADKKVLNLFKQFLEERNAGYFSYTPKEQLRSLLVLKKPAKLKICNPIMVKDALLNLNIAVLRVENFKAMWNANKSYNRYLVEVSRDTDLQQLFQCKKILNISDWQWNKLKNPSITQCRNCQRYGHVASNCKMPYRCVKCKDPHEAGKCTRNQKQDSKNNVYCHNCKKTGHPSNYRGCPAYKTRCAALNRQRESSRFSAVLKKAVMSVNKALQESNQK